MRAVRSLRVDSVLSSLTVAFQSFKNIFLASSSPNVLTAIIDEAYDTFRGIFPKVPYFTEFYRGQYSRGAERGGSPQSGERRSERVL